jgi:hypothetical protein
VVPELVYRFSLATFIYGVAASGVLSLFHGTAGDQRVSPVEVVLLSLIGAAWVFTCLTIVVI